jgi:hypothetical protein
MTRRILILLLIICLALVVALPALACPPPPPQDWGCSPGFWKTHSRYKYPDNQYWGPYETWHTFGMGSVTLMEALRARGHGSDVFRYAAADFLNTAVGTWGPCD